MQSISIDLYIVFMIYKSTKKLLDFLVSFFCESSIQLFHEIKQKIAQI